MLLYELQQKVYQLQQVTVQKGVGEYTGFINNRFDRYTEQNMNCEVNPVKKRNCQKKTELLKRISVGAGIICLVLTGCQKTPKENAVVSKAEGLSESVIAKPLEEGEIRETDIPIHWQMEELRNKDRMLLCADLDLEEKKLGNLPVIEMKNHVLTEDELKMLVEYFTKGEDIYERQPYTKDVYKEVISRIENREGIYAASYHWLEQLKIKQSAENGMALAPKSKDKKKKAEIGFTTRFVDKGYEKAVTSKLAQEEFDVYENRDAEVWFEADAGEDRTARIEAQTYDAEVGNSSLFSWRTGLECVSYTEFDSNRIFFEYQQENPFTPQMLERMQLFEEGYTNSTFDRAAGEAQAKQVLEDLGITDMSPASDEPVLWFPKDSYTEGIDRIGEPYDLWWAADPASAEYGYRYVFSREIGGLNVINGDTAVIEKTEEMYSPPFPAETITITVTKSGMKSFVWQGMSEEVRTITENTKLLPFEKIQARMAEQIFYWYSGCTAGQPEDDPTQFQYRVTDADMGYTYITAYGNPKHAWLVPAWSFLVIEGHGGENSQYLPCMIEALEGRAIIGE